MRFSDVELHSDDEEPKEVGHERPTPYLYTNFQKVLEFDRKFNLPIAPMPNAFMDRDRENLRNGFLIEEFCELLEAQGYGPEASKLIEDAWAQVMTLGKVNEPDIVEIADALADLKYFAYGSDIEYGIDSDFVFAEVHGSNMSKLGPDGKPIYREDGKVLKGPDFYKPNIVATLGLQLPLV